MEEEEGVVGDEDAVVEKGEMDFMSLPSAEVFNKNIPVDAERVTANDYAAAEGGRCIIIIEFS